MNNLLDLKEKFANKQIDKQGFIQSMWEKGNSILFNYKELLEKTPAIKDISISKEEIIFTLNNGIKLYAIENDYRVIPIEILNFGCYEELLWDKTISVLDKNPDVIFDIGGNIGYFSLYLRTKFSNAQFYCFEPIPKTFEYLKKDIEINKANNINIYNMGLTNKKQRIEMFYNPRGCGGSSIANITNEDYVQKILADFSTLDDFVKENNINKIDFIKCDVEGAEKFVYEGGLKTLERFKPVIYSEMLRKWSAKFNYHPNDIINLLKPLGYECFAISNKTYHSIKEVTDETFETNYIFK